MTTEIGSATASDAGSAEGPAVAKGRTALMAAALAGTLALTVTACGGGSQEGSPAAPTSTATSTGGSGTVTPGAKGGSPKLQGSWVTTNGGKIVALVITGEQAGIFATGGTVCRGTAGPEAGMQMIHLKCGKGSSDRATGMVDSVTGESMRVTWSGKVGQETYTKAEGGRLPAGLSAQPKP